LQENPNEIPPEMPKIDPPTSAATVSLLLNATVSALGAEKLITPNDLRGNYATLREALSTLGPEKFWPDVDTLRGKILVIGGGEQFVKTLCSLWSALWFPSAIAILFLVAALPQALRFFL
jgi:hypothetical protein